MVSSQRAGADFGGKWVDLLKGAVPAMSQMAVLWNSVGGPSVAPLLPGMRSAAQKLGVKLELHDAFDAARLDRALDAARLDRAFTAIRGSGAGGLSVTNDPFFYVNRIKLVEFAAAARLPALYFNSIFADAGGFMSYGSSLADAYRRAATHVSKILKGANPADLAVEQPTRFEMVLNLKTAKALGRMVPQTTLLRANRVIE